MLSFLGFFLIISLISGIPIHGFKELYRVFSEDKQLNYLTFTQLLLRIFVSAALINGLLLSLILLLSSKLNSKKQALAWSLTLVVIASFLTANVSGLKSAFNPIYSMDAFNIFLGRYERYTDLLGKVNYRTIFSKGYNHLALFVSAIPIILKLTSLSFLSCKKSSNKLIADRLNNNLLAFEIKKIIYYDNRIIYLTIISIIVFTMFFTIKNFDEARINYILGENGLISNYKKAYDESSKDIEKHKKDYIDKNNSEDNLDSYLSRLIEMNNYFKQEYQTATVMNTAYRANDGKSFYKAIHDSLQREGQV